MPSYGQSLRSMVGRTRDSALRLRSRIRPPPVILMYHRIADESFDPWGMAVTPPHFREQLEWLSQHRTVLRLQAFAALHRARRLPPDAVAVTIDDGYSCCSELASSLLEQFRVPATIFIPLDLIERGQPFWWDELEELVLSHEGHSLTFDGAEIPIGQRTPEDRQWKPRTEPVTARQSAFREILTRITRKRPVDRDRAIDDLRRQVGAIGDLESLKRPMTPQLVRGISSDLVDFGSHTLNHPWLTDLDPNEQAEEIGGSVDRLKTLTGSQPVAFAYPYGISDEHSRRLVEEAGFECACVTGDRAVSRRSGTFALPRVRAGNWDAEGLAQALSCACPN